MMQVRVSKRSGTIIPRPEILSQRRKPRSDPGPKDTLPEEVLRQTYFGIDLS